MTHARIGRLVSSALAFAFFSGEASHAAGDLDKGARASGACMACHSFAPGRQLTGPSLADVWGRKAGTVEIGRAHV